MSQRLCCIWSTHIIELLNRRHRCLIRKAHSRHRRIIRSFLTTWLTITLWLKVIISISATDELKEGASIWWSGIAGGIAMVFVELEQSTVGEAFVLRVVRRVVAAGCVGGGKTLKVDLVSKWNVMRFNINCWIWCLFPLSIKLDTLDIIDYDNPFNAINNRKMN